MDSAPPSPAHSPQAPTPELLRDLIRQRRFKEVLGTAPEVLAREPGQRDALLCLAIAQRYLGQLDPALRTLARLEGHHPRYSRLFEERGRCYVELRQAQPATQAFVRALQLNPALSGSWTMLEGLYRMQGQTEAARRAAAESQTLRQLPPEVLAAAALFADADLVAAENILRAFLLRNGDHVEAMRLLARIGIAHRVYLDAQILLQAVLERVPEYRAARHEHAFVLIQLHRFVEARSEVDRLLKSEPEHRGLRLLDAATCAGLGEHEQALERYRKLLGTGDDDEVHLAIGHLLKTLGRTGEAIESYRLSSGSRGDFGEAYWSLANLKTYRFTDAEIGRMREILAAPAASSSDRYHALFALGKALEDRGDYAESFRCYTEGNALKRLESRSSMGAIERNTARQIQVCTAEFFARRSGYGCDAPDPIFIVGLPRSGSTLLEQILASHSQVTATLELPDVQRIVSRLHGFGAESDEPRYPRILETFSAADFRVLGEEYLSSTRAYRDARPFFIDKMPNNFRHLGLIHLMLPNAKIIDARREPVACCFSNFKQLFANGQEFTYSIEDIARYYRTYLELMRHWQSVLPGRILRIQHEEVVENLEGSVRRLLDFCGLPFEEGCLRFNENRRSVRTASSEQVRRAINREGLDQWRNFEPWLGPLKEALGDALLSYRD